MSKPNIRLSSDPDRCFSSREDPEEVDSARTEQLAAELMRVVRPTLANPPLRRENAYIALDAVAWVAAIILDCTTEDRDALDFFNLALAQNVADLETRDGDCRLPRGADYPAASGSSAIMAEFNRAQDAGASAAPCIRRTGANRPWTK